MKRLAILFVMSLIISVQAFALDLWQDLEGMTFYLEYFYKSRIYGGDESRQYSRGEYITVKKDGYKYILEWNNRADGDTSYEIGGGYTQTTLRPLNGSVNSPRTLCIEEYDGQKLVLSSDDGYERVFRSENSRRRSYDDDRRSSRSYDDRRSSRDDDRYRPRSTRRSDYDDDDWYYRRRERRYDDDRYDRRPSRSLSASTVDLDRLCDSFGSVKGWEALVGKRVYIGKYGEWRFLGEYTSDYARDEYIQLNSDGTMEWGRGRGRARYEYNISGRTVNLNPLDGAPNIKYMELKAFTKRTDNGVRILFGDDTYRYFTTE